MWQRVRTWVRRRKFTRDSVLFVAGILGIGYETIFTHADRPSLLFLFGAMIGLPAFLRTDEKRTLSPPPPPTVPGDPASTPISSNEPEVTP